MAEFLSSFGEWRFGGWLLCVVIICAVLFWLRHKYLSNQVSEITAQVLKEHGDNLFERATDITDEVTRRAKEGGFFANIKYSIFALVAIVVITYSAFFLFRLPVSSSPAEWGQMGDFFGGMLNPILAFASFIALLSTIRIQSEELRLTREEFRKSVAAQERMAKESENQLSRQILLEDYRHIANQLRLETEELNELVKKPIVRTSFPLGSEPPANIEEFLGVICQCFNDNTERWGNPVDSVFRRANAKYRERYLQKLSQDGSYIYMNAIRECLRPVLRATAGMTQTTSIHSEMTGLIPLNSVQDKIRKADLRSSVRLLVLSYIVTRTIDVTPYDSESFVPSNSDVAKLFKEVLLDFGLPSEALDINQK